MTTDALRHQPLMPHLLIDGLNRFNDEPCLFLGDKVATLVPMRVVHGVSALIFALLGLLTLFNVGSLF